jgi:hypothetical protein
MDGVLKPGLKGREEETERDRRAKAPFQSSHLKSSSIGVSRPLGLILPEGDHGYREGMPPDRAEPREVSGRGGLGPIVSYEELIINAAKVARARSASASPQSPRTKYPVPEKQTIGTQAQTQETSATDSDKPEPRPIDTLTRKFDGSQHKLQAMTQGFKEMIRSRKWAQKAHARRERRRAGRQKEVGNQPHPPWITLRKSQTWRIMGAYRLKRRPSPRPKTGHHRQS